MPLDFIVANDLHLADKPPLGRKEGYRAEGLAMLRECVALANEHDAILISTGDLFHVKRAQNVSHALIYEVIQILYQLRNGPMLVVPGNHDMSERGLASIPQQPLGVLYATAYAATKLDGLLATKGWIFDGRPYNADRDADPHYYTATEIAMPPLGAMPVAVIAHGSIIPPGQQRPYPTVTCTDIDMTGINLLCSGHIHEDLGIYTMQDGPKKPLHIFANIGALGRCSRTEANMTRTIKVLGVKRTGQELTLSEIPLKSALPAADIFVEHVVSDIDSDAISEVVAEMATAELGLEGASFEDTVRGLGLSPELEALIIKYLAEADSER